MDDSRVRRVHGYIALETEVRPSPIDKLGLFAKRDIPRGTVVAAWGGRILTRTEIDGLPARFRTNYSLPIYPGFYLAEAKAEDLDASDFINHSCDPNCHIVNFLIMLAKRRIKAGEELTADFDCGRKSGVRSACHCGSGKCRRFVYF